MLIRKNPKECAGPDNALQALSMVRLSVTKGRLEDLVTRGGRHRKRTLSSSALSMREEGGLKTGGGGESFLIKGRSRLINRSKLYYRMKNEKKHASLPLENRNRKKIQEKSKF